MKSGQELPPRTDKTLLHSFSKLEGKVYNVKYTKGGIEISCPKWLDYSMLSHELYQSGKVDEPKGTTIGLIMRKPSSRKNLAAIKISVAAADNSPPIKLGSNPQSKGPQRLGRPRKTRKRKIHPKQGNR